MGKTKKQQLDEILFAAVDTETGADVVYQGESRDEYAEISNDKLTGAGQLIEFSIVFGNLTHCEEVITQSFRDRPELCDGQSAADSLVITDNVWSARVRPPSPIPFECSAVHGIRDEDLTEHPDFDAHFGDFIDEIKGFVLLIHNAAYDWPVLKWHAEKIGRELEPYAVIDTFRLARLVLPDQRYHSNQYLMHQFGVPRLPGHLAAPDAAVTLMNFQHLIKLYKKQFEDHTLEGLCSVLSQPVKRKAWPFGKWAGTEIEKTPWSYLSWWVEKRTITDWENEDWELNYWIARAYDDSNRGRTNKAQMCLDEFRKSLIWPCYE